MTTKGLLSTIGVRVSVLTVFLLCAGGTFAKYDDDHFNQNEVNRILPTPEESQTEDIPGKLISILLQKLSLKDMPLKSKIQILLNKSFLHAADQNYQEAQKLLEQIYDLQVQTLGVDNVYSLLTAATIDLYIDRGKNYDENIAQYLEIYRMQERVLGIKHPDTEVTRKELKQIAPNLRPVSLDEYFTNTIIEQAIEVDDSIPSLRLKEFYNDWRKIIHENKNAESAYLHLLYISEQSKQIWGVQSKATLYFKRHLINILMDLRKFEVAIAASEDVYKTLLLTGGDQSEINILRMTIAKLMLNIKGKDVEAENILEEVLQSQISSLGSNHPNTLYTMYRLMEVFISQNKQAKTLDIITKIKAIELQNHLTEIQLNSETYFLKSMMAQWLYEQKKFPEALPIFEELNISHRKNTGIVVHYVQLRTKYYTADIYYHLQNYNQAYSLFNDLLKTENIEEMMEKSIVVEIWFNSKMRMAEILQLQNRFEEALKVYEEVYRLNKQKLGSEHPKTLIPQLGLANVLLNLGALEDSLGNAVAVYEIQKKNLGMNDRSTLKTQYLVAAISYHQQKFNEAIALLEEIVEVQRLEFGENDRDMVATKSLLIHVLESRRQNSDADQHVKDEL